MNLDCDAAGRLRRQKFVIGGCEEVLLCPRENKDKQSFAFKVGGSSHCFFCMAAAGGLVYGNFPFLFFVASKHLRYYYEALLIFIMYGLKCVCVRACARTHVLYELK